MTDQDLTPEDRAQIEKLVTTTKRGFDLKKRLQKRGLRQGKITLYLDEETGPELGDVRQTYDGFGNVTGIERIGILGSLDLAKTARAQELAAYEAEQEARRNMRIVALGDAEVNADTDENLEPIEPPDTTEADKMIADLEAQRDALVAKLDSTALVLHMRAVPPVIEKDTHRLAKQTLGIEEKNVPEAREEEFTKAKNAHIIAMLVTSIHDNESDTTNTEVTYEDGVDLIDLLPKSQFARLDTKLGELQFTDAISRQIEQQEDFS